jgi:hypothetical protein
VLLLCCTNTGDDEGDAVDADAVVDAVSGIGPGQGGLDRSRSMLPEASK